MSARVKKFLPALKHAGYSTTALLPGEDPGAFKKLHQDLIVELAPNGALEEDIVAIIARLVWRRQNLGTFRIAERVRERWAAITSEKVPASFLVEFQPLLGKQIEIDPAVRAAAWKAAKDQARAEFGAAYDFVEMGEIATVEQLAKDLVVEGRLDAMIERCLKRLLYLRGLKSISTTSASEPRPLPAALPRSAPARGRVGGAPSPGAAARP